MTTSHRSACRAIIRPVPGWAMPESGESIAPADAAEDAAAAPRPDRMRRPDRAAVLPRVPRAARRASPAVRRRAGARCDFIRPPLCDVLGMSAALRHRRAHGRRRRRHGPSAGLRSRPRRGPLQRRDAHAGASVQVRRPARCARAVRAVAGRGRARAAAGHRRDRAGAAQPAAPAAAPLQPGRGAGLRAVAANRRCRGPACCCGGPDRPRARSA